MKCVSKKVSEPSTVTTTVVMAAIIDMNTTVSFRAGHDGLNDRRFSRFLCQVSSRFMHALGLDESFFAKTPS